MAILIVIVMLKRSQELTWKLYSLYDIVRHFQVHDSLLTTYMYLLHIYVLYAYYKGKIL